MMNRHEKVIFALILALAMPAVVPACRAADPMRTSPGDPDPYSITLFRLQNFEQPLGTWKLEPGMRMKGVASIKEKPLSILMGDQVAVIVFPNEDFKSIHKKKQSWTETMFGTFNEKFWLIPYIRYRDSVAKIDQDTISYYGCSIVIHRKNIDDFLGVYLHAGPDLNLGGKFGQFYGLPESAAAISSSFKKIVPEGPYSLDLIAGGTGQISGYPSMSSPNPGEIEVILTSPEGALCKFHDSKVEPFNIDLGQCGIQSQISTIKLRYTGPFHEDAYIYSDPVHVKAPEAPDTPYPTPKYVQMTDHFTIIGSPPPVSGPAANVQGTWTSNIGAVYEFSQSGTGFTWTAPSLGQEGSGTLAGDSISTKWTGNNPGWAEGRITKVDSNNIAQQIEWNNGVIFSRKSQPAAQEVPDISGAWKGALDLKYDITQSGNSFTWVIAMTGEQGSGTIDGKSLAVKWSGPLSNGSAKGTVVAMDASGRATHIDWDNGAVFTRESAQPAPQIPDISGKWKGALGLQYEITQTGNSFTWLIALTGEKGSGTIDGNHLDAKWSGPLSNGSAKGTVVATDASGRVTRIDWDNGAVFER